MAVPPMFIITLLVSGAAVAAEPLTRSSEVPELASMALLSVVFAGASVVLRRTGAKAGDRDRRAGGSTSRP